MDEREIKQLVDALHRYFGMRPGGCGCLSGCRRARLWKSLDTARLTFNTELLAQPAEFRRQVVLEGLLHLKARPFWVLRVGRQPVLTLPEGRRRPQKGGLRSAP